MKSKNTQSGITLIALVVTIVVLLILAGITISFVLSEGGIFQTANTAKDEQMAAVIRDLAGEIYPVVVAEYYAPTNELKQITFDKARLQKFFPDSKMVVKEGASISTDGTTAKLTENASFVVVYNNATDFTIKFTGSVPTVTYTAHVTE